MIRKTSQWKGHDARASAFQDLLFLPEGDTPVYQIWSLLPAQSRREVLGIVARWHVAASTRPNPRVREVPVEEPADAEVSEVHREFIAHQGQTRAR